MNVFAIIVVTLLSMVVGMFWYSPAGFGKPWMKLNKFKKKDVQPKPGMFIFALIASGIMYTILAYMIAVFGITSAGQGAALAALFWLGFMAPKEASPTIWEKKHLRLFFIHTSYSLVTAVLAGAILAIW